MDSHRVACLSSSQDTKVVVVEGAPASPKLDAWQEAVAETPPEYKAWLSPHRQGGKMLEE